MVVDYTSELNSYSWFSMYLKRKRLSISIINYKYIKNIYILPKNTISLLVFLGYKKCFDYIINLNTKYKPINR